MNKRYNFFLLGIAFIVLSATSSFLMLFLQGEKREKMQTFVESRAIDERLSGAFMMMNDFPGSASKDMLFLRSLASLTALYTPHGVESWRFAHDDLQRFMERNEAYDEIHLFTPGCVFTVHRLQDIKRNTPCVFKADAEEQDVLDHVARLPQGSVHISPLRAYTRMVNGKSETIPAILYGTQVSVRGSKDSIIIAVVNADYFLEDVRRLKREGENVFLLNADGSYIANPDATKEKFAGGTANFYDEYQAVPKDTLINPQVRQLEIPKELFTFMRIIHNANNFALYDSGTHVSSQDKQNNSFWIMAVVSEKTHPGAWWFNASYLITFGIIFITHLLVIIFMYVVLFPIKN